MNHKHFLLCLLLFFLFISQSRAGEDRDEAKQVALTGYKEFLDLCLDPVSKKQAHLGDEDTPETAVLGAPIALRLITPDNIRSFRKGQTVAECSEPIKSFFFPVLFNNDLKLMMTVDKYEGNDSFSIASLGYDWLARELTALQKQWPLEKGYAPVLLMSPQTHYYAVHFPRHDAFNLTVLHAGRNVTYRELTSVEAAMKEYKEYLDRVMPQGGDK